MGVGQKLLRPVARLAGWHAATQLRRFLDAHNQTEQTQQQFLTDLLQAHGKTAFGKDHGLSKVKTYEDFKAAVPICDYEYYRPYIKRVLHGETTALLPQGEKVLMFSMTSGTTGEPKHIPVTNQFLDNTRRGWNVFGINLLSQRQCAWVRPVVQISSSMHEQESPTGVPCGAISGLLAATQKKIVRRMYVIPQWASEVTEPDGRFYTILRYSIDRNVAFITTANPSSTIKLIETGQKYAEQMIRDLADGTLTLPAGKLPKKAHHPKFKPQKGFARHLERSIANDGMLLPKHYWNLSFLTNWTGGTLRLYIKRLREYFPNVPIYDIGLLASEGRFSVPLEPDSPAGVAEITSNFLEFIPAEEREKPNPTTLQAHELEEGHEYFLVISNWTGLMRYNIDDRVRVTGFHGQSPVFEFLSRGLHTSNITGEKVTEHQVVEAMRIARKHTGTHVERFVMQGRFPASGTPHYELSLETPDTETVSALAHHMDEALKRMNIEYEAKRKGGRLESIKPIILPHGTLDAAELENIRMRRGRTEQYKHQYLLTEILEES